jgi:prophage regulatory protein
MTENNGLGEPLVGVKQVAAFLGCSDRNVYRLVDSGRMPRPFKLGGSNRWNHREIVDWTNDGCPSCRATSVRGRRR